MLSIDIGCVRLFERHLASDPPAPEEVAALRRDVREHLGKVPEVLDPSSARRVVGVAGTVTTVTAIALDLEVYDPERIHHATIDAGRIGQTAERLAAMTIAERAALPVMAKGREDVIAAGALVLDEICRTFGFGRMIASETDILDGVLLGLARQRAAGRGGVGELLAGLAAHHRLPQRRLEAQHVHAVDRLLAAAEEVGLLVAGALQPADHSRTSLAGVPWRPDDRRAEDLLELADAGLHHALLVLGGVVVGVLSDVAMLASHADRLGDTLATGGLELVQLPAQALIGLGRQVGDTVAGWLGHGSGTSLAAKQRA